MADLPAETAAARVSGCSEKRQDDFVIRVFSVDDHALLREGIAALVGNQPDMELVAEAVNGREAVELFRQHRPDVTLMDLQMPEMNGIDALSAIRGEFPEARVIVLTTYTGDVQVFRALKAGARAYLLKGLLRKELIETIRAVHAGQKRLAPEIAAEIAEHAIDDGLTPREVDVLRLISGGTRTRRSLRSWGSPRRPSRGTSRTSSPSLARKIGPTL